MHGAGLDAQATTGAVLGEHLQGVHLVGQAGRIQRNRLERLRRIVEHIGLVVLGPQHAVRADEGAVAALDAVVLVPDRDDLGHIALLVLRGARGERTIGRQLAHRQRLALLGHHGRGDVLDEVRRERRHGRQVVLGGGDLGRHVDLVQVLQGGVDGGVVLLHDLHRLLRVGLGDRVLDGLDRVVLGKHATDLEVAGLQHRVGAVAQAHRTGHLTGVDRIHLQVEVDDLLLHRGRQMAPDVLGGVRAVDQHRGALRANASTSMRSRSAQWCTPMKPAWFTR